MPKEHHIIVKKSKAAVYLQIDENEYRVSAYLARQVGDALYKAGCDVQAQGEQKEEKK